ncbi:uncharacterized protein DS421_15g517210 [Arachis hypogaea]|uniref:Uncharacterized protein n=1 Tax=Arachis hypogaea TaxID=3818 RepID=A0A444YZG2_ARAHY|nr:uncharacterized protein DS421_15g517210 [Arachis hypogaea]RYR07305.1 hypothetical protein Ahy_B05g074630 isoform F [Arachis hypogaea]
MCSAPATAPATICSTDCSGDDLLSGVILRQDFVLSPMTISSGRFSSDYNLCCFLQRSSSAVISSGSDLLHQRFSSIDEICCASVSYGIELCSATSTSPLSLVEHLASLWTSHYEMLQMIRFEIEALSLL